MKFIIIFLSIISSCNLYAQNSNKTIEIDYLNNIYTVNGNELNKYTSDKKQLSNFSNVPRIKSPSFVNKL